MEDTQPWYKQFWLWFIIFLPTCAVVASLYTVYIAFSNKDSLVKDNYYKAGKAINMDLSEQQMANDLNIHATVNIDLLVGELELLLTGKFESAPEQLMLELIHPVNKSSDVLIQLRHTGGLRYTGQMATSALGRRYVQLSDSDSSTDTWRIKTEVTLDTNKGSERIQFKLPD